MHYDINSKIEERKSANKRQKRKHHHDNDILSGDASRLANETFPVNSLPDKTDAPVPSP